MLKECEQPGTSFKPSADFGFWKTYRKREFPLCSVTYRNLLKLPNSLVWVKFSTLLLRGHVVILNYPSWFLQISLPCVLWRTMETTYQYTSNILFYILSSIWHKPFNVCSVLFWTSEIYKSRETEICTLKVQNKGHRWYT